MSKTVLVTGSEGFIGRNLCATLEQDKSLDVLKYDVTNTQENLQQYLMQANHIIHLAGINRPDDVSEYDSGNRGLTEHIMSSLDSMDKKVSFILASSIQAGLENPYGLSKRAAEQAVFSWGKRTGNKALVYRLPNVFGKWCRPNYNSVVATFCHNIAHGLPITISNRDASLNLVYIDDVVAELVKALHDNEHRAGDFCEVPQVYTITLGALADVIQSFKQSRSKLSIPDMSDKLTSKLYSTYVSYLPANELSYELKMNQDNRGSFTEFMRTDDRGQVSVNISKPGIVKGNHWHHSKNEKFLVVSGSGVIRLRHIHSDEVIEYHVNGEQLKVVDLPAGYTHNIENLGDTDMVTIMWASEPFDPERPDTYFLGV